MESDKIIQAFTQVVREQDFVFSPEAIATIPELQQTLAELETQPPEVVEEALRKWFIEYKNVRDAVLIEEREIEKVRKTKPTALENTIENRYRVLQEELQKLKDKKTPPQNNQSNQP